MNRTIVLGLLAVLSFSVSAIADEKEATLMGTVMAVTSNQITVRAVDGHVVNVPINQKTEFRRSAAVSDVDVGMRIVIQGDATSGTAGKLVRLPAARTSRPPDQPAAKHSEDGTGKNVHTSDAPQ